MSAAPVGDGPVGPHPGATDDRAPRPRPADPADSPRGALGRLLLVIAAGITVAVLTGVWQTVAVVVAIVLMIVLHEFGHFTMAKLADMKVTEFFVGFGRRLWSFRRGETEYGIKAAPLGGYVKIIGMNSAEEVDPADEPRSLRQKPYWRKLSVLVAGSAMHFLLALVLLYALFAAVGVPGTPSLRIGAITALSTGPSPAEQAGFRVGDTIVAVDGQTFKSFPDVTAYIQANPGRTIDVTVARNGQLVHLTPTLVDLSKVAVKSTGPVAPSADKPTGFLGIEAYVPTVRAGPIESFSKTGGQFVDLSARTLDALGSLVTSHGVRSYGHMLVSQKAADNPNSNRFVSPVGIVRIAHQATENGLGNVLWLLVLINVFVGLFNLLPLLPLDGGHIAVATYERLRSRKGRLYHADIMKLMPLTYGVVLVLGFIFVSSLFLDVRDLLSVVRIP